jgi:hypothetical protein
MTPDKKERIALKIRLLQRGLNYRDLAKMTGRSPGLIANLLCGNDPYWPGRAAVNAALGEPIFSKRNMPGPAVRTKARRARRSRSAAAPVASASRIPAHVRD